MPDLAAALDRGLLDSHGVMKEPVSGESLSLAEAIARNLIINVLVSEQGSLDRVTRVAETFRLRVDSVCIAVNILSAARLCILLTK